MTADFGNFVDKTDEKRKMKDEMNPAKVDHQMSKSLKNWFSPLFESTNKGGLKIGVPVFSAHENYSAKTF